MKWNKLNWEIPLSLARALRFYIEKQTAYSNTPNGCDIQS